MAGRPLRWGAIATIVALLVAGAAFVGFLLGRSAEEEQKASRSSPSPSISTEASPTVDPEPTPSPTSGQVSRSIFEKEWVEGDDLWLWVSRFSPSRLDLHPDCILHSFARSGEAVGVYHSDCQSWEERGYDILRFWVNLQNPTDHPVGFHLGNFVLVARSGAVYGPVSVWPQAERPPEFLPENVKIPPNGRLEGYVTFDGRLEFIPTRLSYEAEHQTLTVTFDGRHRALQP